MSALAPILEVLEGAAAERFDELRVTQLSHALQCAANAEREAAPAPLVAACLLHDIGHLIDPGARESILRREDARHEVLGAAYLERWFGPDVTEPVRWHVAAKRYLAASEPGYAELLSRGSTASLELQGGPMSDAERAEFEARPHFREAVALRRWDERAKDPDARPPALDHFLPALEACRGRGAS